MLFMLASFVLPIISFFLQAYPRFINKLFGVDVWTRLLETDHIRKNKHRIPKEKLADQFIIDGYFDYPPVFPTLLSYIPKKSILSIQGFVAPFVDALQVLFVYFIALYITNNPWLAFTAQAMYMLTPMIAIENSYLTPRSLGYLNFTLATFPLLLFYHQGQWYFYILGVFFTTLLFLTHRFAIQSFFFISLFFTFFLNTGIFIQSLVIGFFLALLITKGYYLRVLKGHLYNIYFWTQNLDYRFAHQVRGIIKKDTKTDFVNKIYTLLSVFSPIAIFGLNPWAISGFALILINYLHLVPVSSFYISMAAWIIFFYVLGVIVLKTKYLMPIGEGQRYMEMATVPASILAADILFSLLPKFYGIYILSFVVVIMIINFLLIVYIQIKGVINDKNRSITDDLTKVFSYINRTKKNFRIICIPHQNTTMTIYHTKAQVFVNADNPGLMRVQEVYPILKVPLKELAKKYDLTHALVKESFVTLQELHLSGKNVEYVSGDVLLVKLQ